MIASTGKPPTGNQRKTAALSLLARRREAFVNRGRRALLARLLGTGTATIDVVRDAVELPDGMNPVCFGAVPSPLARAGIIVPDGFTKSRRPDAHARPVQVWRLADHDAAVAWLADHPDRPDPAPPQSDLTLFDLGTNQKPPVVAGGSQERNSTHATQVPC